MFIKTRKYFAKISICTIFAISNKNKQVELFFTTIMKLTLDSLKNLIGFEILDEYEVLNDWKNVEIENPVVKRDGKYTEITFTVVKKLTPYYSYLFGGQILTLTLEGNKIYDF